MLQAYRTIQKKQTFAFFFNRSPLAGSFVFVLKCDIIEYYGATWTKQEVAKGARISKNCFRTMGDPCVFERK